MSAPLQLLGRSSEHPCRFAQSSRCSSGLDPAAKHRGHVYLDGPIALDRMAAGEVEEKLKWDLVAAQARVDIWRTEQANNRLQDRSTQ